jgi:hypothetical protein
MKRVTPPKFDIVICVAIAWCLMDVGAMVIGREDAPVLGVLFALAIPGSLFLAYRAWRQAKK